MKELRGNLFDHIGQADAICITTNGFRKRNGACVMGRGCAKEAAMMFPQMPLLLGNKIKKNGNIVHRILEHKSTWLCSFPVKGISATYDFNQPQQVVTHMREKFKHGEKVPGWAMIANPQIIQASMLRLTHMADHFNWESIILPRPGCGAGELYWDDIKNILKADDRFSFITF